MRDLDIWQAQLFSCIRELADEKECEALWLGADPNRISSFVEAVAHVFNDYEINDFLRQGRAKAGLTEAQWKALVAFRDEFTRYLAQVPTPYSRPPLAVLRDPRWSSVSGAAKVFVDLLGEP